MRSGNIGMESLFIWLVFTLLSAVTVISFKSINYKYLKYSDGILFGMAYFLIIPLFCGMVGIVIESPWDNVTNYYAMEDLDVTVNIFIGWTSVLIAHRICRSVKIKDFDARAISTNKWYAFIIIILYFLLSTYSLLASGLGEVGSHWHANVHAKFQSSTTFIILKNFAASYRVMIFGYLAYMVSRDFISKKYAILIGVLVATFDMSTTFNRISFIFLAFMILLIYRKKFIPIIFSFILILPMAADLSAKWPVFRGVVFQEGFTVEKVFRAWDIASATVHGNEHVGADFLNVVFEASNIAVLGYVIKNAGDQIPYMYGETYILRPLTTFIPSTLWPDKPKVFATYLGMYAHNSTEGLAINSTLFGEPIGNFGYLWPFILLLSIILFNKLYVWLGKFVPGASFMGFFIGVSLWRFDSNYSSVGIYSIVLLMTLYACVKLISSKDYKQKNISAFNVKVRNG